MSASAFVDGNGPLAGQIQLKNSGGRTFEAADIAKPFREEIKGRTPLLGKPPCLVAFLANTDPAAQKYADWTRRACTADGIHFDLRNVEKTELERELQRANADPEVHGILIFYPVFGSTPSFSGESMDDYLRDSIDPRKDVEGLCHTYRSNLYRNVRYMDPGSRLKCVLPCTPLAVVKILEGVGAYDASLPAGNRMSGKTVTVINRSEIVGRPLAALLANDGATVYSVDLDSTLTMRRGCMAPTSYGQEQACRESDVIVLGVPTKDYKLNLDWVRKGTIVVNVASFKNVDEAGLLQTEDVKFVKSVGKVTVAMLERNLLRLYDNFHRDSTVCDEDLVELKPPTPGAPSPPPVALRDPQVTMALWTSVACAVVSSAAAVYCALRR